MNFSYRKLDAYQLAREYVKYIYSLLRKFPREENYALCDQLRRSSVSIPSNIAEGVGRFSRKEQLHFLEIAFGSLNESMCQMELAFDLSYINEEELREIENKVSKLSRILSGWRRKLQEYINEQN